MAIKRTVFKDEDCNHAALIGKLREIKVTQNDFFQFLVEMFISDDESLASFTARLIEGRSKLGRKPKKKLGEHVNSGRLLKADLGLSDEERSNIFDILEKENFD